MSFLTIHLRSDIAALDVDPYLGKLARALDDFNLFDVLEISTNEIKHSNLLSWLLSPTRNHGTGGIFLERFLRAVADSATRFGIEIGHRLFLTEIP